MPLQASEGKDQTAGTLQQPGANVTARNLLELIDIESFIVSPDRSKYAVLVRQADADCNCYRSSWYIGRTNGGELERVADAGDIRLALSPAGRRGGNLERRAAVWAPDSSAIAFTATIRDETHLWTASATGEPRQLSHGNGDIGRFAWLGDGAHIGFEMLPSRSVRSQELQSKRREGFRLENLQWFHELLDGIQPEAPLPEPVEVFVIDVREGIFRIASESDKRELSEALATNYAWGRSGQSLAVKSITGAEAPPIIGSGERIAWLERIASTETGPLPMLRISARVRNKDAPIPCDAVECVGQQFSKVWWSSDGAQVIFWKKVGTNLTDDAIYAWNVTTRKVTTIVHNAGERFIECDFDATRLICARETLTRPSHIVKIDIRSHTISELFDPNKAFPHIDPSRVARISWALPADKYNIGYPSQSSGYVIYPPNFDPKKRYPLFVAPYGGVGFRRGDVGDEHPLYLYAEHGMVVLNTQFPLPLEGMRQKSGQSLDDLYSAEHGYPHLTMLADSTWRAIDQLISRGFIDPQRIGIGGVSHGSFVPLFMMRREDKLAAISIGGPGWSEFDFFSQTKTGRLIEPNSWKVPDVLRDLDISYHAEALEAPLLVHYADREFFNDWRLPRSMELASRVFEAYIFQDEYHFKWQPAHRLAIYSRNLRWFQFWLEDIERSDTKLASEYAGWRELRRLQCKNPRSVRDFCLVESMIQ